MDLFGDLLRGHTDLLLLSIVNQNDSYGYLINKVVEEKSQGKFSFTEATLYTSFKRLVEQGYLNTYWLESESGKKRKYYSITESGIRYLKEKIEAWEFSQDIVNKIIDK